MCFFSSLIKNNYTGGHFKKKQDTNSLNSIYKCKGSSFFTADPFPFTVFYFHKSVFTTF